MQKIMFDTHIFDKLPNVIEKVKKSIDIKYEVYVTSLQVEELCNIPDLKKEKRCCCMIMLADLRAKLVPTSVFLLGKGRLGYARLGVGEVYNKILNKSRNNINDALIADTAVFEKCILITDDKKLYQKMMNHSYPVMNFLTFIETLEDKT